MKSSISSRLGSSLLGLAFEAGRLEVVHLQRTNGSVEVRKAFAVGLSLDPLMHDPQLAGREIRKHLDAQGVRERRCAVCVPEAWAMTLSVEVPELGEEDLRSLLQLEAEKGFPYPPESLIVAHSRYRSPAGGLAVTLVAMRRDHLARLQAALTAARLRPLAVTLGITALDPVSRSGGEAVLSLVPGVRDVGLQVSCGGGLVMLRTLESPAGAEGADGPGAMEGFLRELRITLGQLPVPIRESLRRVRILGAGDRTEEVREALQGRAAAWGMSVEEVTRYRDGDFPIGLPAHTPVAAALSAGMRGLGGGGLDLDFLPPRASRWEQLTARYASRRLGWAGMALGAAAAVVAGGFLVQQTQIWYWGRKWSAMAARVTEIEARQQEIRRYRPWFDDSFRSLSALRRLTEAFPEDGTVSARTVELRPPATVICNGNARDRQALLKALDKLRQAREVSGIKVEQMRGRTPMEFTFNFQWNERGTP